MPNRLSDKAFSILTFAAYHSLVSGDVVSKVTLDDGKGHVADAEGVEELVADGLFEAEGERGQFTPEGAARLAGVIAAIRDA